MSRAQADENLALVARGSGRQYLADFDAVTAELGPPNGSSGLLAEAEHSVPSVGAPLTGTNGPYAAYLAAHTSVVNAANSGQFPKAVELATGNAPGDQLPVASAVSTGLQDRIHRAQAVFDAKAAAASHDLGRLGLGIVLLVVLAAVLAFLGLQQRINEYR